MALRNQKPVLWPPSGLSDALDGTDEFRGACSLLANLMPLQNQVDAFISRPAAQQVVVLPDYAGGGLTGLLSVGNNLYGMYASAAFPGHDRPFAYNMATGVFATISGMSAANLPTSQPTTGDWTPPTLDQVGTRVVFTHPGFPGGTDNAPYYNAFFVNTHSGSAILDGINSLLFPFLMAGMKISGPGIPANTTISAVSSPTVFTTASGASGGSTITVASAAGIANGQLASGPGIPSLTTVTNVSGTTITLSQNLTANLSSTLVTFSGAVVVISANATASANQVALSVVSSVAQKFGWLDLSGFSLSTQVDTTSGLPVLTGNPTIAGVQPGMTVSGAGIPANTVVTATDNVVVTTACSFSSGSAVVTITGGANNGAITVGQTVAGAGIMTGTQVVAVNSPNITLSQNTTGAGPATLTFSGAIILLSNNATATMNGITVSIVGGTTGAPQWGAGDTNINPLPSVPIFVRQFFNRAYFGVNTASPPTSGVVASDPAIACQVSQLGAQSITFADTVPVTAAQGLALFNQLGGIVQSLMVFQGASNIRQITGDPALGNWSQNSLLTATGTLAPNSIAPTPKGLMFVAPDGLRMIDFDARVSDPIGVRGKGIVVPFANSVTPSRMSAAYNENVYRITVTWQPPVMMQIIYGSALRTDEFWFHFDVGKFSGPHTCTTNQVEPWQQNNSFIGDLQGGGGFLWRSDTYQSAASGYVENGAPLTFTLRTVLLPDDESMNANRLTESGVFSSMSPSTQWLASAIDDQGVTLDQAYIWLGPTVTQAQLPIYWENPIEFRQMFLQITGNCEPQTMIGTIGLRYQKLRYQFVYRPSQEFILGQDVIGGPGVLGP